MCGGVYLAIGFIITPCVAVLKLLLTLKRLPATTSWVLLGDFLSSVVNFRSGQVMIPRCL